MSSSDVRPGNPAGPAVSYESKALATLASRLCDDLAPGASAVGAESAAEREPLKSIDNAVFEPRHHSPVNKELQAEAASLQHSLVSFSLHSPSALSCEQSCHTCAIASTPRLDQCYFLLCTSLMSVVAP